MLSPNLFIGLMSGTSLDGVDAVLVAFEGKDCHVVANSFSSFPEALKVELLALNTRGENEVERTHLAGNALAHLYSCCIKELLARSSTPTSAIRAIGCHGQTIRHRPDLGYTVQIGNAALLAELSRLTVIADFRSRDVAAGGQGAPLVPAFHRAVFGSPNVSRVILNIGGISNISYLHGDVVLGFDCGPGNMLMDGWIQRHQNLPYDRGGQWAAGGSVITELLHALLTHPFFTLAPPKSTGRDDFHLAWVEEHLKAGYAAQDVQATLLELTALSIVNAIDTYCSQAQEIYLCGGGAYNVALQTRLGNLLRSRTLALSDALGIPSHLVEATAFAWLARQTLENMPGNLPAVTGARGLRILGAIYPA